MRARDELEHRAKKIQDLQNAVTHLQQFDQAAGSVISAFATMAKMLSTNLCVAETFGFADTHGQKFGSMRDQIAAMSEFTTTALLSQDIAQASIAKGKKLIQTSEADYTGAKADAEAQREEVGEVYTKVAQGTTPAFQSLIRFRDQLGHTYLPACHLSVHQSVGLSVRPCVCLSYIPRSC